MTDKVESIYVYVEVGPSGAESIVGAHLPGIGHTPLVSSRERLLPGLDELARQHARRAGVSVELRQFAGPAERVKVFGPEGSA